MQEKQLYKKVNGFEIVDEIKNSIEILMNLKAEDEESNSFVSEGTNNEINDI